MTLNICWLRSDLRVTDNTALWQATRSGPTIALYVATPGQWRSHHMAGCRVDFLLRTLNRLREGLATLGIPLLFRQVDDFKAVPELLAEVARQFHAVRVFWNREYPLNETRRDVAVRTRLEKMSVEVKEFDDNYILPPGSVLNGSGRPYRVFTPFSRRWRELAGQGLPEVLMPTPQVPPRVEGVAPVESDRIPPLIAGFPSHIAPELWPAGEQEAQQRLDAFLNRNLEHYAGQRDLPGQDGTSRLSPYLAVGAISARQLFHAALTRSRLASDHPSLQAWINELIWREFYGHLMAQEPGLSRNLAFRVETEAIAWRDAEADLVAWQQGRTGIPLVDAGMRQLLETGWMHNRVRMVTAMFLSKNLLIDWRKGEEYFMRHLIDGDFAQNNGGWQWAASTGTDAVPYFRIFNPFSQARRFDPDAGYIHRYVPELRGLGAKVLHRQEALAGQRPGSYPEPIVDPGLSRQRALRAFRDI